MAFAPPFLGRIAGIAALVLVCQDSGSTGARQQADIPVVRLEMSPAQAASPLPALPVTRLDDRPQAADLDRASGVSLTFSEPLPVRDVLLLLVRGTPFSVVFEPSVNGKFVGELSDLSLRQALDAVLDPLALSYTVTGPVIRISPKRPETRLFELNRLDLTRTWRRTARSGSSSDGSAVAADLSSTTEGDAFRELSDGIAALLSPSGRVHVDRKAGLVQVTDFTDRLDRIGLYIEAVSVRSARQVRLDARVLEVALPQAGSLDWSAITAQSGVRAGTGAGIRVDDFDALLRAIASFGTLRVLAAPQMLAMNNEPAVMRIGSHSAAFATGAPGGTALPQDGISEALTLTIVPQVAADGIVQMSVSPTFTARPAAQHPGSIIEADTTMRVRAGETVVLAGFIRDVVEVFGGSDRRAIRKELIVLLTPTIVTPASAGPGLQ